MKELIPDYSEIDKVFLVSPIEVRPYLFDEFKQFVQNLLFIIKDKQKGQKIVIICNSEEAKESTWKLICNEIEGLNLEDLQNIIEFKICRVLDIWIRDYFSCANYKENNQIGNVKALYSPSYNSLAAVDDAAGILLSQEYFEKTLNLSIKLDGGNVISNSKYIFCTNKLYSENYYLDKHTINNIFQTHFQQELITLAVENLDVVGHTDCILRFLDDKTILLPIYPAEFRVDNRYIMNIRKQLIEQLGSNYEIVFLPSYLSDDINDDNIFSASGLFLNFFRFEDYIVFPSFENLKNYEIEITRIFRKNFPQLKIVFSPCDKIAFEGGCLNCITNVKYK